MKQQNRAATAIFTGRLAAPLAGVLAVVFFAGSAVAEDADTRAQDKVLENIKPVGQVYVGEVAPAPAAAASAAPAEAAGGASAGGGRSGEQVYNGACVACHSVGVAGAPKVGDKAAWEPRAAQGMDTLLQHATTGIKAMPPMGTCADCSADELKGAIEYMLEKTGL